MTELLILLICRKLLNNNHKLSDKISLTFDKDKMKKSRTHKTKCYEIPDILKNNTWFKNLIKNNHVNYNNTKFVKRFAMKLKPQRFEILNNIRKGFTYDEQLDLETDFKNEQATRGFIYETIVILTIITKQLIPNFEHISDTRVTGKSLIFKPVKRIEELILKDLYSGNNEADISIKINGKWCPCSIKYRNTKCASQLVECKSYMETYGKIHNEKYGLGYIVKDKTKLPKHHDKHRLENEVVEIAKSNNLLLDSTDVKKAYNKLQQIIQNKQKGIKPLCEWIDSEYLDNPRTHLKLKFNQQLARLQFNKNINNLKHCLSHKPRSGKTITMLLMAMDLLIKGYNKILIMTSIPDTIDSFIKELDKYYEFKDIKYKEQKDYMDINDTFKGIVFCSVQYLKNDYHKKKEILKLFDCQIFDECHFHSSNDNTLKKIINIHKDKDIMQIFASGTSNKTEWFYDILQKCIYKWDIDDECKMKKYINY